MPGKSRLSMAEKRARNRSLTSMLWTPPAYPGYSSCLGSLTKVEPSGIITFIPYGGENETSSPYEPEYSLPLSKSAAFPYRSPPLCSPEDDSEFQDLAVRKTSPNAASSGYASGESDQEIPIQMTHSCLEGYQRVSRYQTRRDRETEKWRRRSVPAAPKNVLPEDVATILLNDGHIRWETNVDTGERVVMEVRGIHRSESVMQLARRFGEIGAAQENDLHRSRTSLDGKENHSIAPGAIHRLIQGSQMAGRPNMFKQMEKVAPGGGPPKQFNPNSIKDALLRWVQSKVQDYPVTVNNFSSDWANGMAFCALIHRFAPHAFDFNKLDPSDRKNNLELAFKVAEDNGIYPLLEVSDMLLMGERPDYKCIFTYVQQFYKQFRHIQ